MDGHAIDQIRSFNRTVQERIGALTDRFLERPHPLGEARLLWEISPDGIEIRALRGRLGLDSGYLSRVLRALTKQRFVRIRVSANDRRVRRVYLTPAGLKERAELDRRSNRIALAILEPLSEKQRATLVAAMEQVDRLLKVSMVQVEVADPTTPEATWCFEQYFAECFGWPSNQCAINVPRASQSREVFEVFEAPRNLPCELLFWVND